MGFAVVLCVWLSVCLLMVDRSYDAMRATRSIARSIRRLWNR